MLETAAALPGPWEPANGLEFAGTGGELVLKHRENVATRRFYRVRVVR